MTEFAPYSPPKPPYDEMVAQEIPLQVHAYRMQFPPKGHPSCFWLWNAHMNCCRVASQARSLYRYGVYRQCDRSEQDYKHCLTLRVETDEDKLALLAKRKAEWWAHRRQGLSSEDVWEVRDFEHPEKQAGFANSKTCLS